MEFVFYVLISVEYSCRALVHDDNDDDNKALSAAVIVVVMECVVYTY